MNVRIPSPTAVSLAAEALATLLVVKVAITLLPFERWRRMLHRESRSLAETRANRQAAEDVVRAVDRATRVLPVEVTCLSRALSVQLMLARREHASRLHVGVARGAHGEFEAHAWVEYEGQVIIGDVPDLGRYSPLPPFSAD